MNTHYHDYSPRVRQLILAVRDVLAAAGPTATALAMHELQTAYRDLDKPVPMKSKSDAVLFGKGEQNPDEGGDA